MSWCCMWHCVWCCVPWHWLWCCVDIDILYWLPTIDGFTLLSMVGKLHIKQIIWELEVIIIINTKVVDCWTYDCWTSAMVLSRAITSKLKTLEIGVDTCTIRKQMLTPRSLWATLAMTLTWAIPQTTPVPPSPTRTLLLT